jgi:nitroimidazol reductase NimA-like FMN-containing flavoprotein (pyridoxamine 5'-phosphate oxidase superfamily)
MVRSRWLIDFRSCPIRRLDADQGRSGHFYALCVRVLLAHSQASHDAKDFPMTEANTAADDLLKTEVLTLLDENRIMSLATVRSDGWPQATMVGYVHDGLTLYFAVARTSQKLSNIQRDPRVSIAIGHDTPDRIRGLSMAARVVEVTDQEEISRLNGLLAARYPEQATFSPREASAAVLKAVPRLVSIVNLAKGPGQPQLVTVESETIVRAATPGEARAPPPSGFGPPTNLG